MVSRQLGQILRAGNSADSSGILTGLYRKMLLELNIGPVRLSDLLHEYVSDPRNAIPQTPSDLTTVRGNFTRELARSGMTFKVFLKALRLLMIVKLDFGVRCHFPDGRYSDHTITIYPGNASAGPVIPPNVILATLLRRILVELDIGPERLSALLDDYVSDPRNAIAQTPTERTAARYRQARELARPAMTFRVFVRSLRLLQTSQADFSVRCHFRSGRISVHGTTIGFGQLLPGAGPRDVSGHRTGQDEFRDEMDSPRPEDESRLTLMSLDSL
ncbi:hypothetical protein [Paraburkholderia adhaesiva]|uniref:hypothetical protein n=1 Tax=Paraburkholderia adhaesiva TaxID=2883244 RepID=UPI001F2D3198|nr:hypothetical protein [Paraburkholderia adhaesiva]